MIAGPLAGQIQHKFISFTLPTCPLQKGGSSTLSQPFLEAMVDAAVCEKDGLAWGRILTAALKEFGTVGTQLKDVHQMTPALVLLDTLTVPPKLQRCLVRPSP